MDRFIIATTIMTFLACAGDAIAQFRPLLPRRTRAPRVCCFKSTYNYEQDRLSNPVTEVTLTAVAPVADVTTVQNGGYKPVQIKTFALRNPGIAIDHCRVSGVAVTIRSDGKMTLSCRAEQNPNLVPEELRPIAVRFERNRFRLTIRPYTNYQVAPENGATALGRPAVDSIVVKDWWLDRFQVKNEVWHGQSEMVRLNFDLINRLEIDLQYE